MNANLHPFLQHHIYECSYVTVTVYKYGNENIDGIISDTTWSVLFQTDNALRWTGGAEVQ